MDPEVNVELPYPEEIVFSARYPHHPRFYLPDGDVVLSAARSLFRVHRGILSYHSPVLGDMFKTAVPSDSCQEMYDDVPLYHLDTSAADLESLLRCLYNPTSLPFTRLSPHAPELVMGVLKLAEKYRIVGLRSRIIAHLETQWPTTLAEWDRLQAEVEALLDRYDQDDALAADARLPEPASAIRLARECAVPTILPAAFYQLAMVKPDHDYDILRSGRPPLSLLMGRRTARWRLLTSCDFLRLLRGKEQYLALPQDLFDGTSRSRSSRPSGEPPHRRCNAARREFKQDVQALLMASQDPLQVLKGYRYGMPMLEKYSMCESCEQETATECAERRQAIWDALPEIFGLAKE